MRLRLDHQPIDVHWRSEAEASMAEVLPHLDDGVALTVRQLQLKPVAVWKRVKKLDPDALGRSFPDDAETLSVRRDDFGGADQQREPLRCSPVAFIGDFMPESVGLAFAGHCKRGRVHSFSRYPVPHPDSP